LIHRVFLLSYFPTCDPASLACAQVEWENAAISGEINAGYGADCQERGLRRKTARFPSATGTNHSASANGTTNTVQPVAKSFNPPLSPPKDRTVSDDACDEADRTGSDSLALQIQTLTENAVAAVYTEALHGLHPIVRIDTVRLVLFSGNALPMRAFAAYSYV